MSEIIKWKINGLLTTLSPLHIGSGQSKDINELPDNAKFPNDDLFKNKVEISLVTTDYKKKAFIPATALKGNLRSWLKDKIDKPCLTDLFGSENTNTKQDLNAGKIIFNNAFISDSNDKKTSITNCSKYFNKIRRTDITTSVAIDRVNKTSVDSKLFHYEFVPPDISFAVNISGKTDEKGLFVLLKALEGFNCDNGISLGSNTINNWGRFNWKIEEVKVLKKDTLISFLENNKNNAELTFVTLKEKDILELQNCDLYNDIVPKNNTKLSLKIRLYFNGFFLVNEPFRVVKDDGNGKTPDHLPASSFRGAFRSQAEKILRTLEIKSCDTNKSCDAIYNIIDKKNNLCVACQVFGASGWKSPVHITDFIPVEDYKLQRQEFVAIDRFTGGGVNGAKFNAKAMVYPVMEGNIVLDIARLDKCGCGLIALTLRDLIEGDITFGFGASKGYGSCLAEIINLDDNIKQILGDSVVKFHEKLNEKKQNKKEIAGDGKE